MKSKYVLLADGNSPHVLKWANELMKYFDLYLISLNGLMPEMHDYIKKEQIYVLNDKVNAAGGNYNLILKVFKVRDIIGQIQPDCLNAHYLSSYGFLAALSKGIVPNAKLIQSTWGSDILVEPFSNLIRRQIAKFALRKADYITSDSWHMSDVIQQLVGKKEVIVFPFGFDEIEISVMKKEHIVFSNRALKSFYNIDKVLRWFSVQDNSYQLMIANDGAERESLEVLAQELDISERVHFVGYLSAEEQKLYYQKSAYYISIPNSDATSVSLLEAMQYGAIPIVSNISANREWILDGVNGVFFDVNKKLDEIKVEEDFAKINHNILKDKALFQKSIKRFIAKVT